jgi:hypothetical protein
VNLNVQNSTRIMSDKPRYWQRKPTQIQLCPAAAKRLISCLSYMVKRLVRLSSTPLAIALTTNGAADLGHQLHRCNFKLNDKLELIHDLGSRRQLHFKFTVVESDVLLQVGQLDDSVIAIALVKFLHRRDPGLIIHPEFDTD